MSETLKIAIPMAGLGTRLRPLTWSRPKPLVALAGRTVLDYILDMFKTVPDPDHVEFVFILGQRGELIQEHMERTYPNVKVSYVVQKEMRGQSDALYLAREYLHGPMIMAFADTLIETDFSFLKNETSDGVAWVKPMPDPRRFGVAELDMNGWISRLIEKPQDISNNLVVVGFYYFKEGEALVGAIEEQMRRGITLKGEYFLADALNILIEKGAKLRTHNVSTWLDAGTPDALLETNRHLLEHGQANTERMSACCKDTLIIPPVYIDPTAEVSRSIIGPHVSLSAGCQIHESVLSNSIVDECAQVTSSVLTNSILGSNVTVSGQAVQLNLGDNSWAMR
ncbi:MAG TPA: sugar phosphate nucleotidyltransferase [Anaerolineaceae bacterium]|nr:sugar phosphate nucleotidyltransferase [Anaerolineaceae bacterium]HPN53484.1 sugar phosphate nucleotidyltransferase [Anaerolineaceae bacterium]